MERGGGGEEGEQWGEGQRGLGGGGGERGGGNGTEKRTCTWTEHEGRATATMYSSA